MRRQGGRAEFWRLLLSLSLAALAVGLVGLGLPWLGGVRHTTSSQQAKLVGGTAPTEVGRGEREAGGTTEATAKQASLASAAAGARADMRAATPSRAGVGQTSPPATRSDSHPSSLSRAFPHSFGPAPEPVAPSSEVASRASEPPPAVVSAPRPAPAPSITRPSGPELQAAPVVPPAAAAPATRPADKPSLAPRPTGPPAAEQRSLRRDRTARPSEVLSAAWAQQSVRSVRFDAGYYYGTGKSVRQLADELTRSWSEKGVNLVYYYAYNRVYGARYRTSYPGNIMEDFGRQDLLGYLLPAAHNRGIRVIAWFYGPQHRQMWEKHPAWREKTADGRDYRPSPDSYHLCVRNPEVMRWWLGLIEDLLTNYPELDGVDVSEPQIDTWGDHACYCQRCRTQFSQAYPRQAPGTASWRQFRADGLTRLLLATSRLIRGHGKESHLTTVFTASRDGTLMPASAIRDATGFDLDAILSSSDGPDVIQAELIWQQWAATYHDRVTFSPDWTRQAVDQARQMTGGRARLIAHLEVTDFGVGPLDGPLLGTTVAAAVQGDPYGIDIYDAHLLDQMAGATSYLQMAWLNY